MPISSMTGFARASGERQGLFWQWEIKSVNGKALDVRLKMPPGFEALETPVRAALAAVAGMLAAFGWHALDPRVRDGHTIRQLDLPVLAEIP